MQNELGGKRVPAIHSATAKAAVQFVSKGVLEIKSIPAISQNLETGKLEIALPEAEIFGRICIGNLLIAQGFELLIKLVFITEKIAEKRLGQHALGDKFEKIRGLSPLSDNIVRYMPIKCTDKAASASELIRHAERAFLLARYIGLKPGDLSAIDPEVATGLLLAITFSYKGMEQIEAARMAGFDINDSNGAPLYKTSTTVSLSKGK